MKRAAKKKSILTESQSDLLASCLVIISASVLLFCWTAISAQAYLWLFVVLAIYGAILWGMILLFTGRSRSEELRRFITLMGILGALTSVFLIWTVFTLSV